MEIPGEDYRQSVAPRFPTDSQAPFAGVAELMKRWLCKAFCNVPVAIPRSVVRRADSLIYFSELVSSPSKSHLLCLAWGLLASTFSCIYQDKSIFN